MLKKTITYQDLDGNPITDVFYFHISTSEVAKMELTTEGGMAERLKRIVAAENGKEIIEEFESILKSAYGVRSLDNKRFIKTDQDWQDFYHSDAYNVLFMQLVSNPEAAAEFVRGVLPANFEQEVARMATAPPPQDAVQANVFQNNPTVGPSTALPYSAQEMMAMLTPEQIEEMQKRHNSQS